MAHKAAKRRASQLGIPFSIEVKELRELLDSTDRRCALSGIKFEITPVPGKAHTRSVSLDKVKSELGYVKGNVRLVLHALNSMKGTGTDEELLELCKAVVQMQRVAT